MTTHEVAAQTAGPRRLPRSRTALDGSPSAARTDRALRRGLLRIEEAAEWLGLSKRKTYDLVARGEIASVYIGRSRRVALAALESFVERLATRQE
jgi:excisionase family DNA binding protein